MKATLFLIVILFYSCGGGEQSASKSESKVENNVPIAFEGSFTIDEDVSIDSMVEGSDLDSDELQFRIVEQSKNGIVSLDSVGNFTYTPSYNFNGSDRFSFVANDGSSDSNVAVIEIEVTPVNDRPYLEAIPNLVTDIDSPINGIIVEVSEGGGDEIDQNISISYLSSNPSVILSEGITLTGSDNGAGYSGEIVISPVGVGRTTITIIANDGTLSHERSFEVEVYPVNHAPVAESMIFSTQEDVVLQGRLEASDVDGDTLEFSVVGEPQKGSLILTGEGVFTYTPFPDINGADSFTYRVKDTFKESEVVTVSIDINAEDDMPGMNTIKEQRTLSDTSLTDIKINIDEGGGVDEDIQVLEVIARSSNTTLLPNENIVVNCSDNGDGCNGTLEIHPVSSQFGTTFITLTVKDGTHTLTQRFTIDIGAPENRPIAWNMGASTAQDAPLDFILKNAYVPAGSRSLEYFVVDGPTSGTLSGIAPDLIYTPNPFFTGYDTFTYYVESDGHQSNMATVSILVGGKALFVVGNPSGLATGDIEVRDRMNALGFDVTIVDDNICTTADADNMDLIVLGSSSASKNINTKYRDVVIPIVTWERYLYDDLQMTGAFADVDNGFVSGQTQIEIVDKYHPLAGGLEGTLDVFNSPSDIVWGKLNENAQVVASVIGDPDKPVLFVYQKGLMMAGGLIAPARRVGYFLPDNSNATLTASGLQLLDAAIYSALVN